MIYSASERAQFSFMCVVFRRLRRAFSVLLGSFPLVGFCVRLRVSPAHFALSERKEIERPHCLFERKLSVLEYLLLKYLMRRGILSIFFKKASAAGKWSEPPLTPPQWLNPGSAVVAMETWLSAQCSGVDGPPDPDGGEGHLEQ